MGVSSSISETINEMPATGDIKKIWRKQIIKENRSGHESEYDQIEESFEYDQIGDESSGNNDNSEFNTPSIDSFKTNENSEITINNDNNEKDQNSDENNEIDQDSDENNDIESSPTDHADQYFKDNDDSESDEYINSIADLNNRIIIGNPVNFIEVVNDENSKKKKLIYNPLYDEFGTKLLATKVIESISENNNVVVNEERDNTIHNLVDNIMSFDTEGKFLLIIPEKKIGNFLEKHSDQRITIITQGSSLESFNEKLLIVAS